jgi:peptide/nickel transport system permease protein
MLAVVLRRVGFSLFSLLVVSLILFLLTRSIPDSAARIVLGDEATEAQIAEFERDHGLDRPVLVQYLAWTGRCWCNTSPGSDGWYCTSISASPSPRGST